MVLLIFWLNKNIKKVMIDDISPDSLPHLAVRIITGNFAIFVNFMSVKYFALTVVAMIINTAPLLTVFLAGPLLKE
jgi:drug/metabolite transporter (DMT)-like permease